MALAAPDLVPVYSMAVLRGHTLRFDTALEPETEVRVLIIPPGKASDQESAEAPFGRVSPAGDDIYVQFKPNSQAVSFKKWLHDEYHIDLRVTAQQQP